MYDDTSYQIVISNTEELEQFLEGIIYPATKREVLDGVYDNGAPDHILEAINKIPDQEYYSKTDLLLTLDELATS